MAACAVLKKQWLAADRKHGRRAGLNGVGVRACLKDPIPVTRFQKRRTEMDASGVLYSLLRRGKNVPVGPEGFLIWA